MTPTEILKALKNFFVAVIYMTAVGLLVAAVLSWVCGCINPHGEVQAAKDYLNDNVTCVWWDQHHICVCVSAGRYAMFHVPDRVCGGER